MDKTELKTEESKGRYWTVLSYWVWKAVGASKMASSDFHGDAQHRCCSGSAATNVGRGSWHAPGDLQFRGGVFLKSPTVFLKSPTGAES